MKKSQIGLEDGLSRQRYSNDKYLIKFSSLDKPRTSKTIFVKANIKFNNVESKNVHVLIPPKKSYIINNSHVYKRNHIFRPTCFYYNIKCHTPNACYIGNYAEYVWVRKRVNPRGSKEHWIARKYY